MTCENTSRWIATVALSLVLSCAPPPIRQAMQPSATPEHPPTVAVVEPPAAPPPAVTTAAEPPEEKVTPKPARQFTVALAMLSGDTNREMERFIFDELRAASQEIQI